jgi:hypothetical protein
MRHHHRNAGPVRQIDDRVHRRPLLVVQRPQVHQQPVGPGHHGQGPLRIARCHDRGLVPRNQLLEHS